MKQAIDSIAGAAGFCPVFVLPGALNARAEEIGSRLVACLLGAAPGSTALRPGAVLAVDSDGFVEMRESIIDAITAAPASPAPLPALRLAYLAQAGTLRQHPAVSLIAEGVQDGQLTDTTLQALFFETDGAAVLAAPALAAALALTGGPAALLVRCRDGDEYLRLAACLPPCAAVCLQVEDSDAGIGTRLAPPLMDLGVPILCNRFPAADG